VGTATYGPSRPDVCAVYPRRSGCPNVGFSYSLNTSALSVGAHIIAVTATDSDGSPDSGPPFYRGRSVCDRLGKSVNSGTGRANSIAARVHSPSSGNERITRPSVLLQVFEFIKRTFSPTVTCPVKAMSAP